MNMKSSMQRAFTQIELIAVIVIIAVLVVLIFPAMRALMEKRKSVACIGNLRQIGQLFALYCNDNQMKLPHANNNPFAWYVPLWPYTDNGKSINEGATLYDFPFLQCPAGTTHQDSLYDYAYDYDLSGRPLWEARQNLYYGVPVTGRRWLLIDGGWYFIRRSDGYNGAAGTKRTILRHNGRANVLFPDFSVQSMSREEINQSLYIFNQAPIPAP